MAQGYGMTECSPRICSGVKNCPKPLSVGEIVPGCEVRIVDGEIQVRSKSVMQGYYKNPEETAKTLTEDGWLMTGDLGYKDEDAYLYITGRKKNLIILSNGENVSPEEIENQFVTFEPIKEIVVYDNQGKITAEVYPNPDMEFDDVRAVIQEKIDEVNSGFPAAKQIVSLVIREEEFEKTASKKNHPFLCHRQAIIINSFLYKDLWSPQNRSDHSLFCTERNRIDISVKKVRANRALQKKIRDIFSVRFALL